ncbi:hypothetical protein Tco_0408430 [Tanacetum coccineum]
MSARPSRPAAPTAGVGSLLPNICPSFHFIGSVIYLTRFQWFFSPVLCLLWFISWTMRLPPSIASLSTYAETNTMDQRESIRQSKYENLVVHLSAGQLLFQSWGRGKDEEGAGGKRYYIKDFDELTAMASEHSSSGPALHEITPATISSGLVPNPPPSKSFVPASRTDWDILFQPMFDELLTPPPSVDYPATKVVAPIHEVSQTTPKTQPPVITNDVEEDNHDIEIALMGNDLYFGIQIPKIPSDQSSSSDSIHTIVYPDHQVSEHNSKWTKDHPLENIIGELDRPVSTRLQLHEQALFCYYDAFLTAVEPKTYKDALT